ncbi:MAG: hypothetical protein AB8G77_08930 [Rhodothermales bacterium]
MISVAETTSIDTLKEPAVLYKPCLVVGFMLCVLFVMPSLVSLVMLCLALHAWRGAKESIEALTILFLVLHLNPGLFPFYGQGASLRWLVLFSAFGRVVTDGILLNARWPFRMISMITLYSAVVIILSVLTSRIPAISIFKIIAFLIGTTTIVTSFYRTRHLQAYWLSWFYSLFLFVLFIGLPLYFSAAGYFTNGHGFQGILIHPQTYGPVTAPVTAYLTALVLLKEKKSPLIVAGIMVGLFSIYASQSRTALLMYSISLVVMFVSMIMRGERVARTKSRPLVSVGIKSLVFVFVCMLLLFSGTDIVEAAQGFVLKRAENAESMSFQVRQSMMNQQIANFASQPLSGIGFGVPSSMNGWVSMSTGFLGIPTGFPVEKGFLLPAVLEETGLIGSTLLIFVFFSLVGRIVKKGELPIIAMILACLLANTGEMVFFSFGGAGLYYWLLIGFCYNSAIPCVE